MNEPFLKYALERRANSAKAVFFSESDISAIIGLKQGGQQAANSQQAAPASQRSQRQYLSLAVHVPPCPYVAAQSPSDPLINPELDPSSLQKPRGFYPPTSVPMAPALLPVLAVALLCLAGAFHEVGHAS
jgi:hypothetical protein